MKIVKCALIMSLMFNLNILCAVASSGDGIAGGNYKESDETDAFRKLSTDIIENINTDYDLEKFSKYMTFQEAEQAVSASIPILYITNNYGFGDFRYRYTVSEFFLKSDYSDLDSVIAAIDFFPKRDALTASDYCLLYSSIEKTLSENGWEKSTLTLMGGNYGYERNGVFLSVLPTSPTWSNDVKSRFLDEQIRRGVANDDFCISELVFNYKYRA